MLTNQTVEILKSLDRAELKRFGDFIKSPYFNTTKPLEKIFNVVHKAYPEFEGDSLSHQKIFKKLYPSEAYNEKRIKNLYSEFSNLLKKFIGYEQISLNSQELDVHIVEGLTLKDLNNISNKIIVKSLAENDDGLLNIAQNFHYLYRLNIMKTGNIAEMQKQNSPEYSKSEIESVEKLIIFFLSNLLQYSFYDIMNYSILKIEENPILKQIMGSIDLEKMLGYFTAVDHKYASYLKIHYLFYYYLLNDIEEEKYKEFKKVILSTIRKVNKTEQNQFIVRMIHMILTKLVSKNRDYYEDIIEFAKLFKELKIYPSNNIQTFNIGTFQDIFITAMSLSKFKWGKNFVNEYVNYLSKELQENTRNYSNGILSFNYGKFEESLYFLGRAKSVGISEKINIRFYYIMNFIELQYFESALSAVQSFRQFITDSGEIPEMFIEGINETLKYFTEVIRIEEKGEKADDFLINEAKEKVIFYKKYITDKLSGIKINYEKRLSAEE